MVCTQQSAEHRIIGDACRSARAFYRAHGYAGEDVMVKVLAR